MPLNEADYRDILRNAREMLRKAGLGGMDERIISEIRNAETPFYELVYYLKMLTEEIALGADEQLGSVLRRVRHTVETESGEPVKGIEVQLTAEESERYGTSKLVFGPDPELQEIVKELHSILNELIADRNRNSESDREND